MDVIATLSQGDTEAQYSFGSVLGYLERSFKRFHEERDAWENEERRLKARIAQLEGERKGQENAKVDLVRRVKMLEFALQQERLKASTASGDGSESLNASVNDSLAQSLDLSNIESPAELLKAMTEGDGRTLTARGGTFDASSRGKSTYPFR